MSDGKIAALANLTASIPRERVDALRERLPPYEAKDKAEDGYLAGLAAAADLLDSESHGEAAKTVLELLAVAASTILHYRKQVNVIRAEISSPEYREWLEEESERMLAGEIKMHSFDDVMKEMEEKYGKKPESEEQL